MQIYINGSTVWFFSDTKFYGSQGDKLGRRMLKIKNVHGFWEMSNVFFFRKFGLNVGDY